MTASADPRFVAYDGVAPTIGREVFVADTARVIGDVHLGDGTSVWYGTVVRGDVFHIRIGDRVSLQDGTVVHVTTGRFATTVGNDVTVGHRAVLHGCTVGDGALIGMNATVMDEAVIGAGAMVAAGALVAPGTVIPPGMVAMGSPARAMRPLRDHEREFLTYSAGHYVDIAQTYLASGEGRVEAMS
ncbi:MAG: gamma carbonic anhydrase family protein [Myxococcota bacterium]|jgi:carbonic anhydrase/acetyltransferase-like protein (isoleucine patch superfamily)|nr:gamma carbonic anhydrase family protein [Myxococcota bacterium]